MLLTGMGNHCAADRLLRREESGGLALDAAVEQARERTEPVKTWAAPSEGSSVSVCREVLQVSIGSLVVLWGSLVGRCSPLVPLLATPASQQLKQRRARILKRTKNFLPNWRKLNHYHEPSDSTIN
jgi:hypothetical protein